MKGLNIILFLFLLTKVSYAQFDDYFYNKTLRVDISHSGNSKDEYFFLDELIEEPFWGGSKVTLVSPFDYGNYKYTITNLADNKLIFSNGFSSIFEEWQTTDEAKIVSRSFTESIVFPYPKSEILLQLYSRSWEGEWVEKFKININSENYFIKKERTKEYSYFTVNNGGNPNERLDIVIIPEGYTIEQMDKFRQDCNKVAEYLFQTEPYNNYRDKINIYGINSPSLESGADEPGKNLWRKTLVNASFYTFNIERYLTTFDIKSVRDIASNVPYDIICIMTNSDVYGGGGIYNYYTIFTSDNPYLKNVFVHELGHSLSGLADEYYTSGVAYNDYYNLKIEPWEPNITTLVNFNRKWKSMIKANTPIPTQSTMKDVFPVGVYEGGGYSEKNIYRPEYNCLMKSVQYNKFCEVCKNSIIKHIEYYLK